MLLLLDEDPAPPEIELPGPLPDARVSRWTSMALSVFRPVNGFLISFFSLLCFSSLIVEKGKRRGEKEGLKKFNSPGTVHLVVLDKFLGLGTRLPKLLAAGATLAIHGAFRTRGKAVRVRLRCVLPFGLILRNLHPGEQPAFCVHHVVWWEGAVASASNPIAPLKGWTTASTLGIPGCRRG